MVQPCGGAPLLIHKPDGSVERPNGEVVYFSVDRFVTDIVQGGCCFVCGASPEDRAFNDEHVIPRWILRKFDLYDRKIGLPNGTKIPYRQYTVPCCEECNSKLNDVYEKPVRRVLEEGVNGVATYVTKEGPSLLFSWLALLFVKTHLKDWELRLDVNRRSGDMRTIGHLMAHRIGELHHLHCVARSRIVGSRFESAALGTFLSLAADTTYAVEHFDYGDFFPAKSVLLRYGDMALIAVLDDSGAAMSVYRGEVPRFEAPLNPYQLREVLAHVSFIASNLVHRTQFGSAFDGDTHVICATPHPPTVSLVKPPRLPLGDVLAHCLAAPLESDPEGERLMELLRQNKWTFLFDLEGRQIRTGVETRLITTQPLPRRNPAAKRR
ncbi:MAG TPA: hypothetical protein VD838_18035 [Anaeromyxobacteraceae bacterium]|nr:hypothetical protein [Anaeromyxobacteraceae bacterium]